MKNLEAISSPPESTEKPPLVLGPDDQPARPSFRNLEQENGLGARADQILEYGETTLATIEQIDAEHGSGYFRKLLISVSETGIPAEFRVNTQRKSDDGGCDEAITIRDQREGEVILEIKTLLRQIGKKLEIVIAHVPNTKRIGWKGEIQKALAEMGIEGVGKNALKRNASSQFLEEIGLRELGNGLFNPLSTLALKENIDPGITVHHLIDKDLLECPKTNDSGNENISTTNAGTKEVGMVFHNRTFFKALLNTIPESGVGDITEKR